MADAISDITCPECGSALIEQSDPENEIQDHAVIHCAGCGATPDIGAVVEKTLSDHLYGDMYIAMTDGGESPLSTCPDCARDTVIFEEGICAACGWGVPDAECAVCHKPLSLDELANSDTLCAYHLHVWGKDDG